MTTLVSRLAFLGVLIATSWLVGGTQPTITSLDPETVHKGWEGVLKIRGTNFDRRSFALVDGKVPATTFKSETLLEADVTKDITRTPGRKSVKVHTGGGGLSNEKTLEVLKDATSAQNQSDRGEASASPLPSLAQDSLNP